MTLIPHGSRKWHQQTSKNLSIYLFNFWNSLYSLLHFTNVSNISWTLFDVEPVESLPFSLDARKSLPSFVIGVLVCRDRLCSSRSIILACPKWETTGMSAVTAFTGQSHFLLLTHCLVWCKRLLGSRRALVFVSIRVDVVKCSCV